MTPSWTKKGAASRWKSSRRWEAITPDQLKEAVKAIRHALEHKGCWQSRQSTLKLCYAALHPATPNRSRPGDPADLIPYRQFLTNLLTTNVEKLLVGSEQPVPVIFKCYIDVLETTLKITFREGFRQFFDVAKVWAHTLGMHPIEWAKRQVEILIADEKGSIPLWIKEVCDARDPSVISEEGEDRIFWGSWRAPRFIHMQPAGNTLYEQATEWTREGLVRSEELVEGRAERMATFLRIDLEQVVRGAYVEFAKEGKSGTWEAAHHGGASAPSTASFAGKQSPDVWRSLHDTFKVMAEEELRLVPRNTGDRWLCGYVDYKNQADPYGRWHLSQGVNEIFRERFDVEAARAGIALQSTVRAEACDVWLHHVFSDLLERRSKLLFAASKDGGVIVRVCEASMLYCTRLEKQALIKGAPAVSAAQVTVTTSSVNAPGSSAEKRNQASSREPALREAVIKKVQNPRQYSVISIYEASLYFEVKPRTIYRWRDAGDLRDGTRRSSITVESVLKLERKRSKRRQIPFR